MEHLQEDPFNIISHPFREIWMPDDARHELVDITESQVAKLLDKHTTRQTVATHDSIPLYVKPSKPLSLEFRELLKMPYDDARVEITTTTVDGIQTFDSAVIKLTSIGSPAEARLTLLSDTLDDTDNHPLNPQFSLWSNAIPGHRDETTTPLPARAANLILSELTQQADETHIPHHENSIHDNITLLMGNSKRLVITRNAQLRYAFAPVDANGQHLDIGTVSLEAEDVRVWRDLKPPITLSHTIDVKKHQPVVSVDSTVVRSYEEITCRFSRINEKTSARIKMEFGHIDPSDCYDEEIDATIQSYCDVTQQYPGRFEQDILRGLEIGIRSPDAYYRLPE